MRERARPGTSAGAVPDREGGAGGLERPRPADPPKPADRRLLAAVEESFLVPVQCSPRRPWWVAAHAALALPLTLRGHAAAFLAEAPEGTARVLCVGRSKRFACLLQRLFSVTDAREGCGRRRLVDPALLEREAADLVLAEVHPWIAPRFERRGWVVIPDAVRWRGDLHAVPPARPSNSLRSDLRRVHRQGYVPEVGGTTADWEEFTERMVFPLARARFGAGAWIASARLLRQLAAHGRIVFVRRDGERVAGGCVVPAGSRVWLPLIGVRDGDRALLAEGASAAVCAFTVDWARATGHASVDWGRTSAFTGDGVQRYNRKWGLAPVPDVLAHLVAVWIAPRRPELRRVFAREPVLVRRGRTLVLHKG